MRCIRGIFPSVRTIYISGALENYAELLRTEELKFGARVLAKPFVLKTLVEMMQQPTRYAASSAAGARTA